jgi:AraC-like DNA-binding protein
MAPIMDRSDGGSLEGLCSEGDWVRAQGPIDGIELLRARFSGPAFARHRHDTYAIGVTEAGVQTFDYRGRVERSHPGEVFVLHPDEMHDGRPGTDSGFGYRLIYVDPARIASAATVLTGRPATLPFVREPVIHNPPLGHAVNAAFQSGLEPLALDDVVLRLTEGLLQADPNTHKAGVPRRVDHAALAQGRAFLDSRRATVRSAELEAVTGLSRYELARQFRSLYGTSPHRYSLMRRLAFARSLLDEGKPLAELAMTAGFADQAHFTRIFRSAFGLTPGRYTRLKLS